MFFGHYVSKRCGLETPSSPRFLYSFHEVKKNQRAETNGSHVPFMLSCTLRTHEALAKVIGCI